MPFPLVIVRTSTTAKKINMDGTNPVPLKNDGEQQPNAPRILFLQTTQSASTAAQELENQERRCRRWMTRLVPHVKSYENTNRNHPRNPRPGSRETVRQKWWEAGPNPIRGNHRTSLAMAGCVGCGAIPKRAPRKTEQCIMTAETSPNTAAAPINPE